MKKKVMTKKITLRIGCLLNTTISAEPIVNDPKIIAKICKLIYLFFYLYVDVL